MEHTQSLSSPDNLTLWSHKSICGIYLEGQWHLVNDKTDILCISWLALTWRGKNFAPKPIFHEIITIL